MEQHSETRQTTTPPQKTSTHGTHARAHLVSSLVFKSTSTALSSTKFMYLRLRVRQLLVTQKPHRREKLLTHRNPGSLPQYVKLCCRIARPLRACAVALEQTKVSHWSAVTNKSQPQPLRNTNAHSCCARRTLAGGLKQRHHTHTVASTRTEQNSGKVFSGKTDCRRLPMASRRHTRVNPDGGVHPPRATAAVKSQHGTTTTATSALSARQSHTHVLKEAEDEVDGLCEDLLHSAHPCARVCEPPKPTLFVRTRQLLRIATGHALNNHSFSRRLFVPCLLVLPLISCALGLLCLQSLVIEDRLRLCLLIGGEEPRIALGHRIVLYVWV